MVILAAIALVVLGPKQLPEVARTVGKFLADLKNASSEITRAVVQARDETNQILTDTIQQTQDALNPTQNEHHMHFDVHAHGADPAAHPKEETQAPTPVAVTEPPNKKEDF